MGRWLYFCLLRLHPRAFRQRFGLEMLSIFDDHAGGKRGALLVDAVISLVRQRLLRPANPEPVIATAAVGQPSDVPVFHVFESYLPRRSALAQGAVLTVAFFSSLTFAVGSGGYIQRLLIAPSSPTHFGIPVHSSAPPATVTTEVAVKARFVDPLFAEADLYFGSLRLLDALDADRDRMISAREIRAAPAVLAGLDRDQDGKLSPEECGLPRISQRQPLEFMAAHPVLRVLDADHDGVISTAEIGSSPVALKKLDKDHDGILMPIEVMQ